MLTVIFISIGAEMSLDLLPPDGAETSALFGDAVRSALGQTSAREASLQATVSPTAIGDMLRGRIPKRPTLIRFADGLGLEGEVRERLFTSAGYIDSARKKELVTA